MHVEVDMEKGTVTLVLSRREAQECAGTSNRVCLMMQGISRDKEIMGGLQEAFSLTPPTHVEREIEL